MADERGTNKIAGVAFAAAAGFGLGILAGLVAGEWLGRMNPERLHRAIRRLRPKLVTSPDPQAVGRAVLRALRSDPQTRNLPIEVKTIAPGLIELTGRVPSSQLRRHAAHTAQLAAGEDVVVNRLLVEGEDVG